MFFPADIIETIAACGYYADRRARIRLSEGKVKSENDYTSKFTCNFEWEIENRGIPGLYANMELLGGSAEQAFGSDACIIFVNDKECKVGVFEAKWPRLSRGKYKWDDMQGTPPKSHFDSQIERQRLLLPEVAIWEMFYCEYPCYSQPSYMPPLGSACIWHKQAYRFSLKRKTKSRPWSQDEAVSLMKNQKKVLRISEVIRAICACKQGKAIPLGDLRTVLGDKRLPLHALVISYVPDQKRSDRSGSIFDR